jgi:hypothetical protein
VKTHFHSPLFRRACAQRSASPPYALIELDEVDDAKAGRTDRAEHGSGRADWVHVAIFVRDLLDALAVRDLGE